MKEISEKIIETQILRMLDFMKNCEIEKINNVGVYDSKIGKFRKPQSRFIKKGASDLSGSINGRCLKIEVKTPAEYKYLMNRYEEIRVGKFTSKTTNLKKKKHLYSQIEYIEAYKKNGAIAFFADSINSTLEQLSEYGIR